MNAVAVVRTQGPRHPPSLVQPLHPLQIVPSPHCLFCIGLRRSIASRGSGGMGRTANAVVARLRKPRAMKFRRILCEMRRTDNDSQASLCKMSRGGRTGRSQVSRDQYGSYFDSDVDVDGRETGDRGAFLYSTHTLVMLAEIMVAEIGLGRQEQDETQDMYVHDNHTGQFKRALILLPYLDHRSPREHPRASSTRSISPHPPRSWAPYCAASEKRPAP